MTGQEILAIEPDASEPDTDTYSVYTIDDSCSSLDSASLVSEVRRYQYENGRRYHAYQAGKCPWPNDEEEQDRLDLVRCLSDDGAGAVAQTHQFHHIHLLAIDGALYRAPIQGDPQNVLDIGTGTGIWAIEMAERHPNSEILGIDLSPIQPSWGPPNCRFMVEDVELDWSYGGQKFDFIHSRGIIACIMDYNRLYRQAFDHLIPGGWIEVQEFETRIPSNTPCDKSKRRHIDEWLRYLDEATISVGRPLTVAREQRQHLIDIGFEDVTEEIYPIPFGTWPKDPKLKELGRFQLLQMLQAVDSLSPAVFSRILNWDAERMRELISGVKRELMDRSLNLYCNIHFVYGRRPGI